MYSPFTIAFRYIKYWLTAANGKGHGTHSPFVYNFIEKVLNDKRRYKEFDAIESLRKRMLGSDGLVEVEDFGAGSAGGNKHQRRIADIAKLAAKPKKYAQLLFRIIHYYRSAPVIELGTSLGITTAYLAKASAGAEMTSLEGAPQIAAIARENLNSIGVKNVNIVTGNFDDTFSAVLKDTGIAGFVFFDGNHRYEPTLRYFKEALEYHNDHSIFVFDDIHWSEEMDRAWVEIRDHPAVTCSIDLYFIGLVFFNPDFKEKQHFVIRY